MLDLNFFSIDKEVALVKHEKILTLNFLIISSEEPIRRVSFQVMAI